MNLSTLSRCVVFASLTLALGACKKEEDEDDSPLTLAEASQAVEEVSVDGQAAMISGSTIELSTSFTIGGAVEQAAGELRTAIASQLPCAEITVSQATLSIEYGKKAACSYQGRSLRGLHTVTITKNAPGEVEVDHTWQGLTDGRLQVDGSATVTWSASAKSRRIQHEVTWTRLRDGRTGKGSGDRTQTPLEGGVIDGIQIDGARSWQGAKGTWDLGISGVQVRWIDPVPQAGSYTLSTPAGRTLSLSFARVDEDTIKVTVTTPRRSLDVNVSRAGDVK